MNIPTDPYMLLSMINMKLRDGDYESLEDLCKSLDIDEKKLKDSLKEIGYEFNRGQRQFR